MESLRWGFVYLKTDASLSFDERLYLQLQAIDMYFKNEEERNIKTERFEGRLSTQGEHGLIGCFGGQIFNAEIELEHRTARLSFIINEQTGKKGSGGYTN